MSRASSLRAATLSSALIAACAVSPSPARASPLRVPGDYPTIQAAIDATFAGDEILVAPGTYAEDLDFPSRTIDLI